MLRERKGTVEDKSIVGSQSVLKTNLVIKPEPRVYCIIVEIVSLNLRSDLSQ